MSRALPVVLAVLVLVSLPAGTMAANLPTGGDAQPAAGDTPQTTGGPGDAFLTANGKAFLATGTDRPTLVAPSSVIATTNEHDDTAYSTPIPVDGLNTSERIDFEETTEVSTAFESGTANVGMTLQSDVSRIDARFETLRFEDAFEHADSDADRRQLLTDTIDGLEDQLADERANEQRAYLAYHQGEITANELLKELAGVHVRATAIDARAGSILGITSQVDGVSDASVRSIQIGTSELTGPVRAHAVANFDGTAQTERTLYVQAAMNGVVLATIDENTFEREAFRADNRDPTFGDSIGSVTSAADRATKLYPWTFAEASGTDVTLAGDVYRVSANHPHGTLTAYLDGGTEAAFREVQELQLAAVPVVQTTSITEANRTIIVERTYPGGPARITVLDADEEPLADVSIFVDGRLTGETNEKGEHWIVAPRERYNVSTDRQQSTSSVSIPDSQGSTVGEMDG